MYPSNQRPTIKRKSVLKYCKMQKKWNITAANIEHRKMYTLSKTRDYRAIK